MALEQSYTATPAGSPSSGSSQISKKPTSGNYWEIGKLRKCYTDYLFNKRQEIDEQIESRRYYHGSQYTEKQRTALKKRNQPIMTFNRIGRKIDGVVGLVEKLRQDPKAYARTPEHEEGAELATAGLRYVLDEQEWKAKSPLTATDGAIDGIGGIELDIIQGDQGDPEIGFDNVDIQSFFYDPRSYRDDFSDARYMGVGKWVDDDIAREMFPDADANAFVGDSELTSNSDREMRWFSSVGQQKRVRLIECWYKNARGVWCWAIFTGSRILEEGESPFIDEKDKTYCKYFMFSGNVDQDGDRYGLIRNMKSAQDGINAKQSKMQHIIASKRLILSLGAVEDVEKARREWARPDGVVMTNRPVNEGVKIDDQSFDFAGLGKLLELNLAEIENFGPNPALIGQGVENSSGRAIALLQQAGMAELGPYILAYRGWKVRVYRGIFNAIRRHWKAPRWIRVTDDEGLAQFVKINGLQPDPMTNEMVMTNAIGSLDVDIILDEAPDAVTLQAQSFEVLQALGPQFMQQFPEIAIELSPLDSATKKQIREKQKAAAQQAQPAQQVALAGEQAKVQQTQADAGLKHAQTQKTLIEAKLAPGQMILDAQGQPMPMEPQEYELPPEIQIAQASAEINDKNAAAQQKLAAAHKARVEAAIAPAKMHMEHQNAQADRAIAVRNADADRAVNARQADEDRKVSVQQADADRKIAAKKAAQKPQAQR
jgi:hypothetical protein